MTDQRLEREGRERILPLVFFLAIFILGSWARMVNAGGSASLWYDEVWRIQRLLEADSAIRQIFSPPSNIDPPAFNLAVILLARIHDSELVLRLVSIIPGMLSILLAYLIGRQLFVCRWLPVFFAFIIAFSPWTTIFSKEMKPYSLGLMAHLSVLYGFLRYRRAPTSRAAIVFVSMLILLLFCSVNIVFAFPGVCILMFALALDTGNGRKPAETLCACLVLLAATVLYYALFLHGPGGPQSSEYLTSYWREGFYPGGSLFAATGWFFSRYLSLYSKMAFTEYSLFNGGGGERKTPCGFCISCSPSPVPS